MGAIVPLNPIQIDESQVGLVDQGGCLQRMPRTFAAQLPLSQSAQLFMDERNQLLECRLVALTPGLKEAGSVRRRVRRGAHPAIEQSAMALAPFVVKLRCDSQMSMA